MNALAIITVQIIVSNALYDLGTLFYNPANALPYSYVDRGGDTNSFTNYYSAYHFMMQDMQVGKYK